MSQLEKEGLPVRVDGKIDFAKAKRWTDKNLDHHRRAARKPDAFDMPQTATETRGEKLRWKAQLRELESESDLANWSTVPKGQSSSGPPPSAIVGSDGLRGRLPKSQPKLKSIRRGYTACLTSSSATI
ncbi:hypothetical protein ACH79_40200 [Bradyrhizobium sp. CCBAU 051011]|nr:hypothetical protein ACH79_40200 [Bradyrhizobium sp. CCBAU 051011]